MNLTAQLIQKKKNLDKASYDEAHAFWKAEWNIAFAEQGLHGITANDSDKFVYADEIVVFRDGDTIAALALISHLNLHFNAYKDLAYLKVMPPEGWRFIEQTGAKKIMTSGYNIVNKEYRRARIGSTLLSIAIPGYVLALFEQRPEFDLCMGMPLTSLGNHKTLTRLGMRDMHEEVFYIHGVGAKFLYTTHAMIDLGPYRRDIVSLLDPVCLADEDLRAVPAEFHAINRLAAERNSAQVLEEAH